MHAVLTSNAYLANQQCVRAISSTTICHVRNLKLDLSNPKTLALHKLYRRESITPREKGYALLTNNRLNKGLAFTLRERFYLGIHGLLPPVFTTEEQQVYRVMKRIREQRTNLHKYVQLDELHTCNKKLFYRVVCKYVKELMPIIHLPTVGLACQKFGAIYRHPKGVYITINDNSISKIYQILSNWRDSDIRVGFTFFLSFEPEIIVVTDGERILGLGDLGAQGMAIPVGKVSIYVALAGIRPENCLPVVIDVGTNNKSYLEDPLYIGLRRNRVRGEEYDLLIDNFMKAVVKKFGRHTLIHFEDFAFQNAFKFLDKYREDYCFFNNDIQGTAAGILAGLIVTTRITKKKLCQQKFLFFGAGQAGLGIAELMVMQMVSEGATKEQACNNIFMIDIEGVSTKAGAFTEDVIKEMATINERPIIFALSNPKEKSECTAEEAIKGSDGKVLFASGSPYDDVEHNGRLFKVSQGSNSYAVPGVALAAVLWKPKKISETAFLIAARVEFSLLIAWNVTSVLYLDICKRSDRRCIREILLTLRKMTSFFQVGEYFFNENLATLYPKPDDLEMYVRHQLYDTSYEDFINKEWEWPEEACKVCAIPVPELDSTSMNDK
ncbi:unnamed protein product [Haemonchus placei]|uniref:Malic enzyme n=1 Tax=Haemonchus placei TaxID=6290 RepID=A0A0N4WRI2_HAEPC|nr:unnamed protein product [Haemonchus placei]